MNDPWTFNNNLFITTRNVEISGNVLTRSLRVNPIFLRLELTYLGVISELMRSARWGLGASLL
ncbi:hypothetical protein RSAG8_07523, partial [Rhizoctonia solani AG-8 WAC10335]